MEYRKETSPPAGVGRGLAKATAAKATTVGRLYFIMQMNYQVRYRYLHPCHGQRRGPMV